MFVCSISLTVWKAQMLLSTQIQTLTCLATWVCCWPNFPCCCSHFLTPSFTSSECLILGKFPYLSLSIIAFNEYCVDVMVMRDFVVFCLCSFAERVRIAGSMIIILLLFILTTLIVKIEMTQDRFFSITMATIWFINSMFLTWCVIYFPFLLDVE